MAELEHFKILDNRAEYRPTGQASLHEAVQLITSAIVFAREHQIRRLLVVTRGLTGATQPTLTTRYLFMKEWAQAAQGIVQVAIVTRPEMIDP
jgi:hypothetical protein